MREDRTIYKILLIAATVISVGGTIAHLMLRHDTAGTLSMALTQALVLLAGCLVLWVPKLSVNYRPRRVNGRWINKKRQVSPNLFGGLVILATIVLATVLAFVQ